MDSFAFSEGLTMSHRSHDTRYSDSSHYDVRCTLCGATDAPGSKALDLPCPAYRAEEISVPEPSTPTPVDGEAAVDMDAVISRVLLALEPTIQGGLVIASKEVVENALRDALADAVAPIPAGTLIVPVEPHPHDVAYAAGMSDLSDLSANPPSREATERELKAFYRTMVSRSARRVR
jgi:hypothetical protein